MTYAAEVLADAPVGYWRFNETSGTTASNAAGAVNLTFAGTYTLGAPSLLATDADLAVSFTAGRAFNQNEKTDYPSLTAEAWIKTANAGAGQHTVMGRQTSSASTTVWYLELLDNVPRLVVQNNVDNVVTTITGPTALNDNQPHHVVGTINGTALRLYVDGAQVASGTLVNGTGPRTGSTAPFYVGQTSGLARAFAGVIDEPAYYSTALSAARILAHYQAATVAPITVAGSSASVTLTATTGTPITPGRVLGEAAALVLSAGDGTPIVPIAQPVTVAGETTTVTLTALDGAVTGVTVNGQPAGVVVAAEDGQVAGAPILVVAEEAAVVAVFALEGTLALTFGTARRNLAGSSRRRDGTGLVDMDVPVAPEPPTIRAQAIPIVVDTLPNPDVSAGVVESMTPTVLREAEWGRIRIRVGTRDVTYFRDKPAQLSDYQLLDPYGYGPASLRFPQVTFWELPDFGSGSLSWLAKNAPVHIDHVQGGQRQRTMWVGHIDAFDFDDDGALLCDCSGELSGRMDKTVRTQRLVRGVHDAGWLARIALSIQNKHYRLSGSADAWSRVGVPMENTGGGLGTNLAFLDYVLANMVDEDLTAWTIMPTAHDARTFDLHRRDYTTVDATLYLGARGVQARLRDDQLEQPTRMFGEGVGPKGDRWRGAEYPNLGPEKVPPYPYNDGRTFGAVGLTDADTDTGAGVRVLEDELLGSGLLDLEDRNGEWKLDTTRAVEEVQRRAGLAVTGRVNPDTWRAVWGDGIEAQRLSQAHIRPLVWQDATEKFRLSPNASVLGRNQQYDRNVPRIERLVSFGEGVTKARARKWLRREMNRANGNNWRGTITLTSDVLAGDHTFGQPGTPMSRLDLAAGMNVRVKRFGSTSGMLMHVASVQGSGLDGDTPQVELAVDTQFRDAITLAEMLERDKAARLDPARRWLNQHRRSTMPSDALVGWDREAGAGVVRRTPLKGNEWNVVPVVGAQAGEVQRIDLTTTDSAAEFVCAVFARPVRPGQLAQRIGNPFIGVEPGAVWRQTSVADWLAGLDKTDLHSWRDQQREREGERKDEDGKWVPPEYVAGNIVRGDNGEWQSVLNPPSGKDLADLQAQEANDREERLAATFELFSDARAGVYVAGTTEQPCGYWPNRKTNDSGNPTGEPVTGQWRDDAGFSYWTLGPRSPWLYLAVWPDRDCTIFGRLYDQLIEGS